MNIYLTFNPDMWSNRSGDIRSLNDDDADADAEDAF